MGRAKYWNMLIDSLWLMMWRKLLIVCTYFVHRNIQMVFKLLGQGRFWAGWEDFHLYVPTALWSDVLQTLETCKSCLNSFTMLCDWDCNDSWTCPYNFGDWKLEVKWMMPHCWWDITSPNRKEFLHTCDRDVSSRRDWTENLFVALFFTLAKSAGLQSSTVLQCWLNGFCSVLFCSELTRKGMEEHGHKTWPIKFGERVNASV